jgi:hypothetical protein
MSTVGWIIWGLLCLFAIGWSFGQYNNYRQQKWFPNQIETVALWWLILAWSLFASLNKLHLLWLGPLAFVGPFVVWAGQIGQLQRPRLRMFRWLIAFALILTFLTR